MATMKNKRGPTKADVMVGERVRIARLEAQMSQAELGDALGVSFQQVQKYEKGANRLGVVRMTQVARALGKPASYFTEDISGTDPKMSKTASTRQGFLATNIGSKLIDTVAGLDEKRQQIILNFARELEGV